MEWDSQIEPHHECPLVLSAVLFVRNQDRMASEYAARVSELRK